MFGSVLHSHAQPSRDGWLLLLYGSKRGKAQAVYLGKLSEQALLLDRRDAANNGDRPDAAHFAHTLQVLTDLQQRFSAQSGKGSKTTGQYIPSSSLHLWHGYIRPAQKTQETAVAKHNGLSRAATCVASENSTCTRVAQCKLRWTDDQVKCKHAAKPSSRCWSCQNKTVMLLLTALLTHCPDLHSSYCTRLACWLACLHALRSTPLQDVSTIRLCRRKQLVIT